jgi:hypothetical protein
MPTRNPFAVARRIGDDVLAAVECAEDDARFLAIDLRGSDELYGRVVEKAFRCVDALHRKLGYDARHRRLVRVVHARALGARDFQ